MEKRNYEGPERRAREPADAYQGPRRRSLDWPFKPLGRTGHDDGNPDKAMPGRADVKR